MDKFEVELVCYRGVKFAKHEFPSSGLVKVKGSNGSGKSTLLSAISWCLYGSPNNTRNYLCKAKMPKNSTKVTVSVPACLTTSGRAISVVRTDRPATLMCYVSNNANEKSPTQAADTAEETEESKESEELEEESEAAEEEQGAEGEEEECSTLPASSSRKRTKSISPRPRKRIRCADTCDMKANQEIIDRELCHSDIWMRFSFLTRDRFKDFFTLCALKKREVLTDICNGENASLDLSDKIKSKIKSLIHDSTLARGRLQATQLQLSRSRCAAEKACPTTVDLSSEMLLYEEDKLIETLQTEIAETTLQKDRLSLLVSKKQQVDAQLAKITSEIAKLTSQLAVERSSLVATQEEARSHLQNLVGNDHQVDLVDCGPDEVHAMWNGYAVAWVRNLLRRKPGLESCLDDLPNTLSKAIAVENLLPQTSLGLAGAEELADAAAAATATATATAAAATAAAATAAAAIEERLRRVTARLSTLEAENCVETLESLIELLATAESLAEQQLDVSTSVEDLQHLRLFKKSDLTWAENRAAEGEAQLQLKRDSLADLHLSLRNYRASMVKQAQKKIHLESFRDQCRSALDGLNDRLAELEAERDMATGFEIWNRCTKSCPSCDSPMVLGRNLKLYKSAADACTDGTSPISSSSEHVDGLHSSIRGILEERKTKYMLYCDAESALTNHSLREETVRDTIVGIQRDVEEQTRDIQIQIERAYEDNRKMDCAQTELKKVNESLKSISDTRCSLDAVMESKLTLCRKWGKRIDELRDDVDMNGSLCNIARWKSVTEECLEEAKAKIVALGVREVEGDDSDGRTQFAEGDSEEKLRQWKVFLTALLEFKRLHASVEEIKSCILCLKESRFTDICTMRDFAFPSASMEALIEKLAKSAAVSPEQFLCHSMPHIQNEIKRGLSARQSVSKLVATIDANTQFKLALRSEITEDVAEVLESIDRCVLRLKLLTTRRDNVALVGRLVDLNGEETKIVEESEDINRELDLQKTLQSLLAKANHESLTELVNTINVRWSEYLEGLIGEDITAELSLVKESKSARKQDKQAKYEVHVKIVKSGVDIGSVQNLSGGEQEKVKGMFYMCMHSLLNNKLMVMDEMLSSLDAESMDFFVDRIKDSAEGLTIMVNHRHTDGRYDKCVDMDH